MLSETKLRLRALMGKFARDVVMGDSFRMISLGSETGAMSLDSCLSTYDVTRVRGL